MILCGPRFVGKFLSLFLSICSVVRKLTRKEISTKMIANEILLLALGVTVVGIVSSRMCSIYSHMTRGVSHGLLLSTAPLGRPVFYVNPKTTTYRPGRTYIFTPSKVLSLETRSNL